MPEFDRERLQEHAPAEPVVEDAAGVADVASAAGNRAFAGWLADGAGLLPSGVVHPGVASMNAATRGGGSPLQPRLRGSLADGLGDPLDDARVHTGDGADQLARSVSARAFTVGSDMYFAHGEYRPGTAEGDRLIAHEAAHVVQQRGAAPSEPLTASQPGDALELEAEHAADELSG
ncbi:MAG: eCIS core domain-containing protein [Gaiellales bacterium]